MSDPDPISDGEIEDVLASIRRLVSSDAPRRSGRAGAPPRPAPQSPERLVLTSDLRISPSSGPAPADAADKADAPTPKPAAPRGRLTLGTPQNATEPPADWRGRFGADGFHFRAHPRTAEERLAEAEAGSDEADPGFRVARPDASPPPDEPDYAEALGEFPAPPDDTPAPSRALTLEQRIAELEAAIAAQPAEFEPDGSEDGVQHRPDRVPTLDAAARRSAVRAGDSPGEGLAARIDAAVETALRRIPDALVEADRPKRAEPPAVEAEEPEAAPERPVLFRRSRLDLPYASLKDHVAAEAPERRADHGAHRGEIGGSDALDRLFSEPGGPQREAASPAATGPEAGVGDLARWFAQSGAEESAESGTDEAGDHRLDEADEDGTEPTAEVEDRGDDLARWFAQAGTDRPEAPVEEPGEAADDAYADAYDDAEEDIAWSGRNLIQLRRGDEDGFGPEPAAEIVETEVGDAAEDEAIEEEPGESQVLDEAALREMVVEIVREELQGALGERITRNVRKLVRREIMRAIAIRDFE